MKNPEAGAGWEIVREFVQPEIAETAGKQVLKLIEEESSYVSRFDRNTYGHYLFENYRLHSWSPSSFPDYTDTITADSTAREEYAELINIHRKAVKTVDSYIQTAQINVFEPNGRMRRHRDRILGETIVVSLLGVGRVNLVDPVSAQPHEFVVNPGDAMHLINPRRQSLRPRHVVKNIGLTRRVTLVA